MVTRTQSIKNFLSASARPDLAAMYYDGMECQVIVAQDGGEQIKGEYKGANWLGYTDGIQTWKPFRIPRNANTEPEYEDVPMRWDLAEHAQAIGMTGWDWKLRRSRWVAYDFDAIIGHSEKHLAKLTNAELDAVVEAAKKLDYVTIRKSSSGAGLHLYVEVDQVPTDNHNEHAALARAILGKMSADCEFDFESNVDICGGNMWVWRRNMNEDSFKCIKQGIMLETVPANWREHIKVVNRSRKRVIPKQAENNQSEFDQLVGRTSKITLDDEHKKLLAWLEEKEALFWWDNDNNMLVTHTIWLAKAAEALLFKGIFKTDSPATDLSKQNCFCNPLKNGAWVVRRFSLGCKEHDSWSQDQNGWTRTYLNKPLDLATATKIYDAVEDHKGNFNFPEAQVAKQALSYIGVDMELDTRLNNNPVKVRRHKDGRVIVDVVVDAKDLANANVKGWHYDKGKLTRIFSTLEGGNADEGKGELYDDLVRFVISNTGEEVGWFVYTEEVGSWSNLAASNVKMLLKHRGMKAAEVDETMGACVNRPWVQANEPFQDEYLGKRRWNRSGAQFRFVPDSEDHDTPHWDRVLAHIGAGLDDAVKESQWCKKVGMASGKDYLSTWISCMFKKPTQPLPYLFLFSEEQNTGKSILHEALSLLMTKGVVRANNCLEPSIQFNGELDGAILCIIEEVELDRSARVYNRLKDWVNATEIGIHAKGATPYTVKNTTHWIHCANNAQACPVFPGDTRIVVANVPPFTSTEIPKPVLLSKMEAEASAFLGKMLRIELPESDGRLALPVVSSMQRKASMAQATSLVDMFVTAKCERADGFAVSGQDFVLAFKTWLADEEESSKWSSQKIYKDLPPQHTKGAASWGNGFWIPNIKVNMSMVEARDVCSGTKLILDEKNVLRKECSTN